MELSDKELDLIEVALIKKIWSLNHVGLPNSDHRVFPYVALREKIRNDRRSGGSGHDAARSGSGQTDQVS